MRGKGILLNNAFELVVSPVRNTTGQIVSGLQVGETLYQNQALILALEPGSLKLSPLTGVGISGALVGNDFLGWRRTIRRQMEMDGQKVGSIVFSPSQPLAIDAKY